MPWETIVTSVVTSSLFTSAVLFAFKRYVDRRVEAEYQRRLAQQELHRPLAALAVEHVVEGTKAAIDILGQIASLSKALDELPVELSLRPPEHRIEFLRTKLRDAANTMDALQHQFQEHSAGLRTLGDNFHESLHRSKQSLRVLVHMMVADVDEDINIDDYGTSYDSNYGFQIAEIRKQHAEAEMTLRLKTDEMRKLSL
jgi:hypothetical protein